MNHRRLHRLTYTLEVQIREARPPEALAIFQGFGSSLRYMAQIMVPPLHGIHFVFCPILFPIHIRKSVFAHMNKSMMSEPSFEYQFPGQNADDLNVCSWK